MLFATSSLTITLFIIMCVGLVDLFLFTLMVFWKVAFNTVTGVNIVVAIGMAVDYSAHIGHAYLEAEPPKEELEKLETNHQIRAWKARHALKNMGSSVMHGAISTILATSALAGSNSFIFMSFFKMYLGIVIFGLMNGFILLPVLLSLCGPIGKRKNKNNEVLSVLEDDMGGIKLEVI